MEARFGSLKEDKSTWACINGLPLIPPVHDMPDDIPPNRLVRSNGKDPPTELISFTAPQLILQPLPAANTASTSGCDCGYPGCPGRALVYSGSGNLYPAMPRLTSSRKVIDVGSASSPGGLLPQRGASGHCPTTSSPPSFDAKRHHRTRDHGDHQGSVLAGSSTGNEFDSMIDPTISLTADGPAKVSEDISGRLPSLIPLHVSGSAVVEHHFPWALYLLPHSGATNLEGEVSATAGTTFPHQYTKKVDVLGSCPSSHGPVCGLGSRVFYNKSTTQGGRLPCDGFSNRGNSTDGINDTFALSENMQDRSIFIQSMASVSTFSTLFALGFGLVKVRHSVSESPSKHYRLAGDA